jgi:hypothetical protein
MPRGGSRKGAGGKSTWKNGKTKPVRVPIALEEQILEIARILDEGGIPESRSRTLDLSGIAVMRSEYGPVVRLADLVRAGYRIKPEKLARNLKLSTDEGYELNEIIDEALQNYE